LTYLGSDGARYVLQTDENGDVLADKTGDDPLSDRELLNLATAMTALADASDPPPQIVTTPGFGGAAPPGAAAVVRATPDACAAKLRAAILRAAAACAQALADRQASGGNDCTDGICLQGCLAAQSAVLIPPPGCMWASSAPTPRKNTITVFGWSYRTTVRVGDIEVNVPAVSDPSNRKFVYSGWEDLPKGQRYPVQIGFSRLSQDGAAASITSPFALSVQCSNLDHACDID
jgi:hypothetical protein